MRQHTCRDLRTDPPQRHELLAPRIVGQMRRDHEGGFLERHILLTQCLVLGLQQRFQRLRYRTFDQGRYRSAKLMQALGHHDTELSETRAHLVR